MEEVELFEKLYKEACDNNQASFIFQGTEVLTSYAKYLLEYLKTIS